LGIDLRKITKVVLSHGHYDHTVTDQSKIRAIIGGTHLGPANSLQQERTIEYLKSLDFEFLAPNHCTGLPIASRLAREFPDQIRWATTGNILEI
jgi:7,8-dihydropterin-6-yl-methyl-4-(beta-D-ribofuranosyl)aminobenzene 5'-phosphate synthase